MSVCVWRPALVSGVVSWRIISICFLGVINLQGKSSSLLTFFIVYIKQFVLAIIFWDCLCFVTTIPRLG